MKKIVFCWSNISGYMATCWRDLTERSIPCHVVAYADSVETSFDTSLMTGVSWTPLAEAKRNDVSHVEEIVVKQQPDVIVLAGWLNRAYMNLVHSPHLSHCKFVMGMDTPWKGEFRQRLAPFALKKYLKQLDMVWVTGERAWDYAVKLGFAPGQIHKGLYGIDYSRLSEIYVERKVAEWPRRFLFLGRLHPEKGFDSLLKAYSRYCETVPNPWPLDVAGLGPLAQLAIDDKRIRYHGFIQPSACRQLLKDAGVFVLPSVYDPWPLALVEAAASGLPVLSTYRCGSSVEVVRSHYNGLVTDIGTNSIFEGLLYFHHRSDQLAAMGGRSVGMAEAFSTQFWCDKLLEIVR